MLILVDADACPVKEEVYKVAFRHEVPVTIVSNSPIRIPAHPLISREVVTAAFDAADDWIAAGDHRHYGGHIAGGPLPEGGFRRHRAHGQAVHGQLHR